ncbi:MAG: hypothetical protein Q4B70_15675, partial [Lachnospiraceae bacterium]|nr:hypothetical protein [Lachnospiraceae bacterium]
MHIRISRKWVLVILSTVVVIVAFMAFYTNSAQRVETLLKSGDYEKAVEFMNEHSYSKKDMSNLELIVEECINTTLNDLDKEKVSYEDTKSVLVAFSKLKVSEISELAQEKLDYVELENSCNVALKSAEKDYSDKKYIDAMATICGIDKSYSQYIIANDLY